MNNLTVCQYNPTVHSFSICHGE